MCDRLCCGLVDEDGRQQRYEAAGIVSQFHQDGNRVHFRISYKLELTRSVQFKVVSHFTLSFRIAVEYCGLNAMDSDAYIHQHLLQDTTFLSESRNKSHACNDFVHQLSHALSTLTPDTERQFRVHT